MKAAPRQASHQPSAALPRTTRKTAADDAAGQGVPGPVIAADRQQARHRRVAEPLPHPRPPARVAGCGARHAAQACAQAGEQ